MDEQKKLQLQLARAKTRYLDLCATVGMCQEVLCGRIRGSKKLWNIVENNMHTGKVAFTGVMDVSELAQSISGGAEHGGAKSD